MWAGLGVLNCVPQHSSLFILVSAALHRNSSAMTVQVRFFASLRERMGIEDTQISLPAGATVTVTDVWRAVLGAAELPANTLVAINQDYATLDAPVRDGDEVAFFPPVTGG